jgi:hypothetical protein
MTRRAPKHWREIRTDDPEIQKYAPDGYGRGEGECRPALA